MDWAYILLALAFFGLSWGLVKLAASLMEDRS